MAVAFVGGGELLGGGVWNTAAAAELSDAIALYNSGKYDECVRATSEAIEQGDFSENWRILQIEAQLATGRYADAADTLTAALERYSTSVRIRWVGVDVLRHNGRLEQAEKMLVEIEDLVSSQSWRYRDPANRVALGRFFLYRGADAKQVLDELYGKVKKEYTQLPDAWIASGDLALQKHDFGLAAEQYEQAVKLDPLNPDVHFGLALAYAPSDSEKAEAALGTALEKNPHHVDSLLELVDGHVDAERYGEAEKLIQRVLDVNGSQPLAWAYRAVIAHLQGDIPRERECRNKALATWSDNPHVDHLIGRKLSQKYRFAEGAAYQRQALAFTAEFLPAKAQLCQDLLRLGDELEGWKLADEVFAKDNYDVVAHNLTTLRDRLTKYRTLSGHGFFVRMEAKEAAIYGDRVLDLLRRAKEHLVARYEVELEEPIYVEIFPHQQDFAIRTFGLPGGAGFLGVCFGRVITMNSPASQGNSPSNWEAVLWHEFCHVVTLTKTNNKMPRWLSEGISVYEEVQAKRSWGQTMNPQYREMILGGELTPVSELSGAFLQPKSALHLQFAYYESSLVVEYLVDKYGLDTLKRILVDLGVGMPINDAIRRYAGSLERLDEEFAAYAKQRAEDLAPKADFEKPESLEITDAAAVAKWSDGHPNNIAGLLLYARLLLAAKEWDAAKKPLQRMVELYPEYAGADSPLRLLAVVHRELGESDEERQVLNQLARLDSDAIPEYLRLLELCTADEDWRQTIDLAESTIAVNPLIRAPHRFLADAAERTGDDVRALAGLRALLQMDPFDPAETHFRVARLLHRQGEADAAKRHLLQSLEEAPRYRNAQQMLLEMIDAAKAKETFPPTPAVGSKP